MAELKTQEDGKSEQEEGQVNSISALREGNMRHPTLTTP
ncbi:unnamed protein product [Gongylonema pulchrum]|uniref:CTNNB1_binding domain-containing protein n=1 Tax=Gongylonema pulchrum TaxID=637853 RepID=A0A183DP53_9BILA|nr:unnamed protein product [Gongylonema pulchrum]